MVTLNYRYYNLRILIILIIYSFRLSEELTFFFIFDDFKTSLKI